jgi:transposase
MIRGSRTESARNAATGRNLAPLIGPVPKQNSSGGKARLGGIAKQGNRYLRPGLRSSVNLRTCSSPATIDSARTKTALIDGGPPRSRAWRRQVSLKA